MKYKDFNISREHAKRLLNKFDLLKSADFYQKPISGEFVRVAREKDFFNAYLTALKNHDYHFLLFDESFLQLEYTRNSTDNVTLRYAYYQFPYDFPTYKEYLMEKGLSFNEVGYGYKYERILINFSFKNLRNPICFLAHFFGFFISFRSFFSF